MYYVLTIQSFYSPLVPTGEYNVLCQENTTLFLFSNVQYLAAVITFSISKPFRRPFYTNWPFLICLIILVAIAYLIIFSPAPWVLKILELVELEDTFKYILVIGTLVNGFASYLFEKMVVPMVDSCYKRRNSVRFED